MSPNKRGTIPIDSVTEDFYVRTSLNDDHVLHLATLYQNGVKLPPILVTRENNTVVDGRHRLAAQRLCERYGVEVEWLEDCDKSSLLVCALKRNVGGSLPPSNSDIVYTLKQMLESGMVSSAVAKQFAEVWPPAVIRRFLSDAQSALTRDRTIRAREAVAEGNMTVHEAALANKIKPDMLKQALIGPKKRRTAAGEIKGTLTTIFRSRGGSMGQVFRRIQHQYEDGDLSWQTVEMILEHAEKCCRATTTSVRDWRKRLEAAKKSRVA